MTTDRTGGAAHMLVGAGPQAEQRAVDSLRDDLSSGRWADRNRDLIALDTAELGLRLLVA
ncbi:hypothetical protein GCM10010287_42600 [Streptomyces variabilis]|uniref:Uncharacterized protein n=2 Tax=Streptomyces griseoincarnatus group TaxID=2867193 RepID=A0ABQ2U3T8_9ACTN|nr:hypothetical protein GCM10010287_42600 [Streptomyces variabilis]